MLCISVVWGAQWSPHIQEQGLHAGCFHWESPVEKTILYTIWNISMCMMVVHGVYVNSNIGALLMGCCLVDVRTTTEYPLYMAYVYASINKIGDSASAYLMACAHGSVYVPAECWCHLHLTSELSAASPRN